MIPFLLILRGGADRPRLLVLLFLGLCILPLMGKSQGAGLSAVKSLEGYSCKSLVATEAQMMDRQWPGVPIQTEPSPAAPRGAVASAIVIAKEPAHVVNGYAEVLRLNGLPGWIEADKLKPYSSASNPHARCTPSLMSNGRPGFG